MENKFAPLDILVVDDERSLRDPLAYFLSTEYDHRVEKAATYLEALEQVHKKEFDVILLDNMLMYSADQQPEPFGIELMGEMRKVTPHAEFIFFTGWGMEDGLEALRAGAYRYMAKPFNNDELAITIRMASEHAQAQIGRRMYSTVVEVERSTAGKLGLEESIRAIVDKAEEISDFDICTVVLLDTASDKLEIIKSSSSGAEFLWTRHLDGEALTHQIIADQQLYEVADIAEIKNASPKLIKSGIRSFAGQPIVYDGMIYGVLYVYTYKEKALDAVAKQTLSLLAELIAAKFKNAQLYKQTELENQRVKELNQQLLALQEVANQIDSELPLAQLLDEISKQAVKLLCADSGSILLLDQAQTYLTIEGSYNIGQKMRKNTREPLGKNIAGRVVETGMAILAHDIPNRSDFDNLAAEDEGLMAILSTPLLIDGRAIGALDVHSKGDPFAFDGGDQRILSLLANQAASAIANARYRARMEASVRTIQALFEGSNAITSDKSPQEVLQTVVEEARGALKAMRVKLVLFHKDRLIDWATVGFEGSQDNFERIRQNRGITWQVMRSEVPWYSVDCRLEPEGKVNSVMLEEGVRAAACIPVTLSEEQLRGAMWFHFDQPRQFQDIEKNWLEFFSNQVAIAFDRSQQIEDLKRLHDAADKLAQSIELPELMETIVALSCQVLQADSAIFWPYDQQMNRFVLGDVKATPNVALDLTARFGDIIEPKEGGTLLRIMKMSYLAVSSIDKDMSGGELDDRTRRLLQSLQACSFLGLLLETEKEALGVIYVNYASYTVFTERLVRIAQTFADQVALAYRRTRLSSQIRESHRTAGIVADLTTLAQSLDETLDSVVKGTKKVLRCDAVTLYTYRTDRAKLNHPPKMSGVRDRASIIRGGIVEKGSLPLHMMQKNEPYIVEDITKEPLFVKADFPRREDICSCIAIPLTVANNKVGVMFVNYRTPRHITSVELDDLKFFANQAAIAIYNAQLYEMEQEHVRREKILQKASRTVAGTQELDVLLKRVARLAWELVRPENQDALASHISLLEEDNVLALKSVHPITKYGDFEAKLSQIQLDCERPSGIAGWVAREGQSRLVGDVSKINDYIQCENSTQSELAVPIKKGNVVIGTINVEHGNLNAFTAADQESLQSLADMSSVAIENALLHEKQKRRIQALESLNQAKNAITQASDTQKFLSVIAEQAWRVVSAGKHPATHCSMRLIQNQQAELVSAYPLEIFADSLSNDKCDLPVIHDDSHRSIIKEVFLSQETQRISDVSKSPNYLRTNNDTKSQLTVPVKLGDIVYGIINVGHEELDAFDEQDEQVLESLALLTAMVIQNINRIQELDNHARYQEAIYAASKAIAADITGDQGKLLNSILTEAVRMVDDPQDVPQEHKVVIGMFQEYDDHRDTLIVRTIHPPDSLRNKFNLIRQLSDVQAPIGICGRAVKSGQAQRVKDISLNPDYIMIDTAHKSELSVPLLNGDKVLGVLTLESDQINAFSEADEQALKALAELAVIAIQSATRYQELKDAKGIIGARTAVAWMGMVSASWRHAVGNDAIAIRDRIELAKRDARKGQPSDRIIKHLDRIQQIAQKVKNTPFTPPLSANEDVKRIDFNWLLRRRLNKLRNEDIYHGISFPESNYDLDPDSLEIHISSEWLQHVIDILVSNAAKAMIDSKRKELYVSTQRKNDRAIVVIRDTGHGISKEKQAILFKRQSESAKGHGVGLLIAQMILQTYGGDIRVAETGTDGTTMEFWLPLIERQ